MNSDRWIPSQIFVYRHPVDMRKQIDGLTAIVSYQLHRDPTDRSMSVSYTHLTLPTICSV